MATILAILQVIIRIIIIVVQVTAKVATKVAVTTAKAGAKVVQTGSKIAGSTAGKVTKTAVKTTAKGAVKTAKVAAKTSSRAVKTTARAGKATASSVKRTSSILTSNMSAEEKAKVLSKQGTRAAIKTSLFAAKTAINSAKFVVITFLKINLWALRLIFTGVLFLYLGIAIQAIACMAILAPVIVTVMDDSAGTGGYTSGSSTETGGDATEKPSGGSGSIGTGGLEGAELFAQGAMEIMEGLVSVPVEYANEGTTEQAGETFRPDCSGYVTGCLNKFFKATGSDSILGGANTSSFADDARVGAMLEKNGFVKYFAKDMQPEDLRRGDIICYTKDDSGRQYGHVCIYYNVDGKLDFGDTRRKVLQPVTFIRSGNYFAEKGSTWHTKYRVVWRYEGKK